MIINRAVWSIKINGVCDYICKLSDTPLVMLVRKRVWVCCSNCRDAHVVMNFWTKIYLKYNFWFTLLEDCGSTMYNHELEGMWYHSKHKMLNQCWFNFGPSPETLAQQWTTIDSTSCVGLDGASDLRVIRWYFRTRPALMAQSYRLQLVTWNSQLRILVGPDICHRGCAYTVLQTVLRPGVYSAVYGAVHYKEPLK